MASNSCPYVLMTKECLQAMECPTVARQITHMSRLAWAAGDPRKIDNPETSITQIAILW